MLPDLVDTGTAVLTMVQNAFNFDISCYYFFFLFIDGVRLSIVTFLRSIAGNGHCELYWSRSIGRVARVFLHENVLCCVRVSSCFRRVSLDPAGEGGAPLDPSREGPMP